MKRLLGLILLVGLIYGGYLFYGQYQAKKLTSSIYSETVSEPTVIVSGTSDKLANLATVLGASISNTYENGKEMLSDATNGASEPIINQLVTKTTETLKDLPRKEAEKIKYEFCKGVVTEFENKSKLGVND